MKQFEKYKGSSKKLIIIIGFILVLSILFLLAYIFFIDKNEEDIRDYPVRKEIQRQKQENTVKKETALERENIKKNNIELSPQISAIIEENTQLLEETDILIANIEEFISDFPEKNEPLEVMEAENYFVEEREGQIAKDRLAAIWKYRLPGSNTKSLNVDSLLTGSSIENTRNFLTVEYWYSPMNYSGYRYQSGRLILFGVPEIVNTNFYYKDRQLKYVYSTDTIYIRETEDFIPINYTRQKNR